MDKKQIIVGQKVYLKPVNNKARHGYTKISEEVVLKVGRKYFFTGREGQLNERSMTKFSIEDLIEVTEYSPDWELYFSEQEILDEKEIEEISRDIRLKFSNYGKINLTLDQLRRIKDIISE